MKKKLSQSTIEKLGYYVYALIDPRSKKVFYIGKGKGNRIYAHVEASEQVDTKEIEKIATIRAIRKAGKEVDHRVVRHGLAEDEAFVVEAALIDFTESVSRIELTNLVSGHHSNERGIRTIEDIEIQYEAPEAVFDEAVLLIRVNKLYKPGMSDKELYEITRKYWRVGPRALKIKYACACYLGIVREVYEIKEWYPSKEIPGRKGFRGKIANVDVRDTYRHTSIKSFSKKGHQSSIVYAGPKK